MKNIKLNNLLSENMRRFGTKNLNEQDFGGKSQLSNEEILDAMARPIAQHTADKAGIIAFKLRRAASGVGTDDTQFRKYTNDFANTSLASTIKERVIEQSKDVGGKTFPVYDRPGGYTSLDNIIRGEFSGNDVNRYLRKWGYAGNVAATTGMATKAANAVANKLK